MEEEFGKLATSEIVLTSEREQHILERHPEDYECFMENQKATVTDPDYVFKDAKDPNTADYVKKIEGSNNMYAVVRVALESEDSGKINSVTTAHSLSDKKLKNKLKILYKKEN